MKKLLLIIPIVTLCACGDDSYEERIKWNLDLIPEQIGSINRKCNIGYIMTENVTTQRRHIGSGNYVYKNQVVYECCPNNEIVNKCMEAASKMMKASAPEYRDGVKYQAYRSDDIKEMVSYTIVECKKCYIPAN